MSRYQRQTCLPQVADAGQQKLTDSHILVVGAGGLGCAVLPYLVSAGIGKVTLVDGDKVSLSNLPRQVLYKESDVGKSKVECAKAHLNDLNSDCHIKIHNVSLTPNNVAILCENADIVLDCADNFAASYVLSDYCQHVSLPLVSASVLGFDGYVGGFCGGKPSLRALFPELPLRAENCSSAGVMGPVVGTIGSIQAQFSLNILLNLSPSPLGQLLTVNLSTLAQSGFRFDKAPEPTTEQQLHFIDCNDLHKNDWVVDLRTPTTKKTDTLPSIAYLSLNDFQQHKPCPDSSQRAIIVCKTGLTAWRAARCLQQYWQGEIKLIAMGDSPLSFIHSQ